MIGTADLPALVLTGVRRSFMTPAGRSTVLDGVDLTVARGEVVAVAGRSGSGKTALLMIIGGWDRPDSGSVVLGDGARGVRPPDWRALSIVPQSLGLLDELTLGENIGLPLRLVPEVVGDGSSALMARLGLAGLADRYPSEVSLGEQQRAALARAAVLGPGLLVADEPISHQNQAWARTMMAVLRELAGRGTACVLATHNPVAFEGADRVLDLRGGRLQERSGAAGGGYVAPHG